MQLKILEILYFYASQVDLKKIATKHLLEQLKALLQDWKGWNRKTETL